MFRPDDALRIFLRLDIPIDTNRLPGQFLNQISALSSIMSLPKAVHRCLKSVCVASTAREFRNGSR